MVVTVLLGLKENCGKNLCLLGSINKVVKVWARGIGQARFDLQIKNGAAYLNLGFQLGHLESPHCGPPPPSQPHLPHGGTRQ